MNASAEYKIVATMSAGTDGKFKFTFTETSGKTNGTKLLDKFCELCNITKNGTNYEKEFTIASKAGQELKTVTMSINGGNGAVTTTYEDKDGGTSKFDKITNE